MSNNLTVAEIQALVKASKARVAKIKEASNESYKWGVSVQTAKAMGVCVGARLTNKNIFPKGFVPTTAHLVGRCS